LDWGRVPPLSLDFLGDEKKLRIPPLDAGAGATGVGTALALNWAMMCGSRLTLRVSVNSSLLCSMLNAKSFSQSARASNENMSYSSNSCPILQSAPNLHSGVVTKWIPLFSVHVKAVVCSGIGSVRLFIASTVITTIN
jgi:hypothetical protein